MVLLWGLIIAGIVALVRYLGGTRDGRPHEVSERPRPEDLLAERFARGEIDSDEYKQRLELLRTSR
ncbi:MAG: SHOCT domain-containing protein [Actinomadura sp.]